VAFVCLAVWRFEFRTSHSHTTTWTHTSSPFVCLFLFLFFALVILQVRSCVFDFGWPRSRSSYLCLLHNWSHRCEPPAPDCLLRWGGGVSLIFFHPDKASKCDLPDLCLQSSWDYTHNPPHLAPDKCLINISITQNMTETNLSLRSSTNNQATFQHCWKITPALWRQSCLYSHLVIYKQNFARRPLQSKYLEGRFGDKKYFINKHLKKRKYCCKQYNDEQGLDQKKKTRVG
jgi:hypothetical protein